MRRFIIGMLQANHKKFGSVLKNVWNFTIMERVNGKIKIEKFGVWRGSERNDN